MFAAILTAIALFEVECFRKDQEAFFIEIEVFPFFEVAEIERFRRRNTVGICFLILVSHSMLLLLHI